MNAISLEHIVEVLENSSDKIYLNIMNFCDLIDNPSFMLLLEPVRDREVLKTGKFATLKSNSSKAIFVSKEIAPDTYKMSL